MKFCHNNGKKFVLHALDSVRLSPPNSDPFVLESKGRFVPEFKKFPQSVPGMLRFYENGMDEQPENTTPPTKAAASVEAYKINK